MSDDTDGHILRKEETMSLPGTPDAGLHEARMRALEGCMNIVNAALDGGVIKKISLAIQKLSIEDPNEREELRYWITIAREWIDSMAALLPKQKATVTVTTGGRRKTDRDRKLSGNPQADLRDLTKRLDDIKNKLNGPHGTE